MNRKVKLSTILNTLKKKSIIMIYNFLLELVSISILTSCGYTTTEDDKYPNMAEFPEVDGKGIHFKKEHIDYGNIYKIDDDLVNISYNSGDGYAYVLHLDNGFNIIDSVKAGPGYHHIAKDGFIYFENDNNSYSKVHYLTHEVKEVPLYPINTQYIYKQKLDSISNAQLIFSTKNDSIQLKEDEQIDLAYTLAIKQFEAIVMPGLLCTKFLGNDAYLENGYWKDAGFIAQYQNKEYSLPNTINGYKWLDNDFYNNHKHYSYTTPTISNSIPVCASPDNYTIISSKKEDFFTIFDEAVMENGGGGNHFVFSFSPIGYDYYKLNYKEREVKFKIYNKNTILNTFYSPDRTALIVSDRISGYYRIVVD